MVGRKRKGSILFILSMLMVMFCSFGMMKVEAQGVYEEPPFYKYTIYGSNGEYVLTINWKDNSDVKVGSAGLNNFLTYERGIDKSAIKKIVISNGITTIDASVFDGFSGLTTVTIPNTVTTIEANAFANCESLASVTIPSGVTSISSGTFYFCTSLVEVSIPNTVTNIDEDAFGACSSLEEITIPSSVTSIGDYAFDRCSSLEEIVIPSSITSIAEYVFNECTSLTDVTIPNSVTSIGRSAFSDCSSLEEITIPSSVTSIGDSAFCGCSLLKEIDVPGTVETIGAAAFANCSLLEKVILREGVQEIGDGAFEECEELKEVHIPSTVERMHTEGEGEGVGYGGAFTKCVELKDIHMYASTAAITEEPFWGLTQEMYMYVPGNVEEYEAVYEEDEYHWGVNVEGGGKIIFGSHSHTSNSEHRVEATPATCTEDGNIEYYECITSPLCGQLFADEACTILVTDIVDPKGHDMSEVTCTDAKKCKREGCDYTEGTSLGGHDMSEATCEEPAKCKREGCDHVGEGALGHDMSEATCADEPKCKREGCDYTEGNSLGHTYGDAVFNWAADYSTATATCTCQNDSSHVLSAQCTVTSEVIKEATATENGKMAYTATVDLNLNTYTDVKMVETPMLESDTPGGNTPGGETPGGTTPGGETPGGNTPGTDTPGGNTPGTETPGTETPDGDDDEYIDYDDVDMEKDDVLDDAKTITLNEKLKVTQTGSQFNIKWGRIKQADGYDIYVQRCGKNFKSKPTKTVKGKKKTSIKVKKLDGKKINLTKSYKVRVIAYKYVDGKKVVLAKSLTAHVVGRKNKKYTNVKSVKVEKSKYTIKVGKTKKIKASVKLEEKGKKQISTSHTAHFRYVSSDKSVATVSKNGKIKAVGKGTCDIYVYGKNGCGKKIKVTVK